MNYCIKIIKALFILTLFACTKNLDAMNNAMNVEVKTPHHEQRTIQPTILEIRFDIIEILESGSDEESMEALQNYLKELLSQAAHEGWHAVVSYIFSEHLEYLNLGDIKEACERTTERLLSIGNSQDPEDCTKRTALKTTLACISRTLSSIIDGTALRRMQARREVRERSMLALSEDFFREFDAMHDATAITQAPCMTCVII